MAAELDILEVRAVMSPAAKSGVGEPVSLTVVVPVCNEALVLRELHGRLRTVLDSLEASRGIRCEIIAVDDGSRDGSSDMLEDLARADPSLRVVHREERQGHHEALMAGFALCRTPMIVSIDADLQNPPEEIPRIVEALSRGYDHVATRRIQRRDPLFRRMASRFANATSALLVRRYTAVPLHDMGCSFRGYSGTLAAAMVRAASEHRAVKPFVSALALRFSRNVCELDVEHVSRKNGRSRYRWRDLIDYYARLLRTLSLGPQGPPTAPSPPPGTSQ
jgi:undecaprenyl-phosphate 4-deoxy-4-formamido-L-arabinose transferase